MILEPAHLPIDSGWIEVICGSMFSGKTEELIRRLRRAQFAGQSLQIFKPSIDTRYSSQAIVSHNKTEFISTPVNNSQQILLYASDVQVIGIDEAQFFDEGLVQVANELANQGKRVIIAGLDMDSEGKPFGPMPYLLATAEYVTKLHAICAKTGTLAHYSHRKITNTQQVLLGEKDVYEPLSRKAFYEIKNKNV
ncbi:MAG: thymidine kinase [Bacteroidia bacterium]|jgi:thymidine kinase|nr:MAG: thymidine kinase [Bacteroidia bacterium]